MVFFWQADDDLQPDKRLRQVEMMEQMRETLEFSTAIAFRSMRMARLYANVHRNHIRKFVVPPEGFLFDGFGRENFSLLHDYVDSA